VERGKGKRVISGIQTYGGLLIRFARPFDRDDDASGCVSDQRVLLLKTKNEFQCREPDFLPLSLGKRRNVHRSTLLITRSSFPVSGLAQITDGRDQDGP